MADEKEKYWFAFVMKEVDRSWNREQWKAIGHYLRLIRKGCHDEMVKGMNER